MTEASNRTPRSGTVAGMKESLKKAVTEMMVLFLLRQKPMYAYEMAQELARLTEGVFTFNTLYLAIYRLQEHGHIAEAGKQGKRQPHPGLFPADGGRAAVSG